ncbi:hypothetical protein AVEN_206907-1 [Araneus ventricosus]|uniref:Uncharacterized protein n=1 Tax=Araneus ventricosus TaxID=182803 RepID=A0A4Y2MEE1_ARAVE|nr:hypothetical protein AVEN_206907-1 [Araneus ventricosus]
MPISENSAQQFSAEQNSQPDLHLRCRNVPVQSNRRILHVKLFSSALLSPTKFQQEAPCHSSPSSPSPVSTTTKKPTGYFSVIASCLQVLSAF